MYTADACRRQTHPDSVSDLALGWALWQNVVTKTPIPFDRAFRDQSRAEPPRKGEGTKFRVTRALQPVLVVYGCDDDMRCVFDDLAQENGKRAIVVDSLWMERHQPHDVTVLADDYDVAIAIDVPFHVANFVSYGGIRTIFLTPLAYDDVEFCAGDALPMANDFVSVPAPTSRPRETLREGARAAHDRLLNLYQSKPACVSLVRAFHASG